MAKIELLRMDCMDYMRTVPDRAFDLAIVDPPYGIGMTGHRIAPKRHYATQPNGTKRNVQRKDYGVKEWDSEPPSIDYFTELRRVSRNQIIWGANHFIDRVPVPSPCWLVWDKVNGNANQADCELAWTSFKTAVRVFPFMWNGMCQGSPANGRKMQGDKRLNEVRIHPTQKPVQLYRWILRNYAQPGHRILDTHFGSGSLAIACHDEGFDMVGTEVDADYWLAAAKRLEQHKLTQPLIPATELQQGAYYTPRSIAAKLFDEQATPSTPSTETEAAA